MNILQRVRTEPSVGVSSGPSRGGQHSIRALQGYAASERGRPELVFYVAAGLNAAAAGLALSLPRLEAEGTVGDGKAVGEAAAPLLAENPTGRVQ